MRVTKADVVARMGSEIDGETGEMVFVAESKSKICTGLLKMPPHWIESFVIVAVAALLMWTCEAESTLVMNALLGIPVPCAFQPTCRMAVDGIFVMMFDPVVMFPVDVNPDGPASADSRT